MLIGVDEDSELFIGRFKFGVKHWHNNTTIDCNVAKSSDFPALKSRQNFYPKCPNYFLIFFCNSFSTQGNQAHKGFGNIANPFAQMVWKNGMVFESSEKYIRLRFSKTPTTILKSLQ